MNKHLLTNILNCNEYIDYKVLQQNTLIKNGLVNLFSFYILVDKGPESREKKYFVAAEDKNGLHCIGFSSTAGEIKVFLEHFYRILDLNVKLPIVEYSIPDIFPMKILVLDPL